MLRNSITLFILFIGAFSVSAQAGHSIYRDTFCANQTILVGNQFFDANNPSGIVTLPGAAVGGIDSVIQVDLTFIQYKESTLNQTLCEGDTLWVNGKPYHAGYYIGEEFIEGGAANGCDSLIHVHLHFRQVHYDFQQNICEGDTLLINGKIYTAFMNEGTEVIPNGACDSILHVKLTPIPLPYRELKDTLCPGTSIMVNGTRYDRENSYGIERLKHASSTGCDSLVVVRVSYRQLWLYAGSDAEIIKGDTICIQEQYGMNPVSLVWSPTKPCPDSSCQSQCIAPLSSLSFRLTATDSTGCVLVDDINIRVSNKNRVYSPTVFNPDANYPNNRFFLGADNGVRLIRRLFIADRWGELLFDVNNILPDDPENGWDGIFRGQVMPPGTYMFWSEIERIDGTTFLKSGSFSLVR